MVKTIVAVVAASFLLVNAALAQIGKTEGEVRKVDKEAGKITLRHGPITGDLDMPGMSMVLQVKDRTLLDRLNVGDRVDATVLKENGAFYLEKAESKGR